MSNGEIVQIHVGQTGVQIANACWEIYCLEHRIGVDGILCGLPSDDTFKHFSSFKATNKLVPRAVLVDSEPTVIDEVRTGPYGCLYNPKCLITGKEDSGSIYSRGYFTIGAELIDITMEAIRQITENCSNLRGFLIYRSIGGGTGSGLGNLIEDQLKDDYERISKMEFIIFPSPSASPLTIEPYNVLLATHLNMDAIECSFILDNEALYDVCTTQLEIHNPRYKDVNRIVGQVASTFTSSKHIGGDSSISLADFQTNLVPYPRIRFPLVSYAPFLPDGIMRRPSMTTYQITRSCFHPSNQLVRCNPLDGKYMSCMLLYRGNVTASSIDSNLSPLRNSKKIRFVDWQPMDFKVGLNRKLPCMVPCGGIGSTDKVLLTLSNNTIISKALSRLMEKFVTLYKTRAYVHHYFNEGTEEDLFEEALEDISTLVDDYKELETCPLSNTDITDNVDITENNSDAGFENPHYHHIWKES